MRPKIDGSFRNSVSPNSYSNSTRQSPKLKLQQFGTANQIAITGYNNQIAIGGNNMIVNLNLNQNVKPKSTTSYVMQKHPKIQENIQQELRYPQQKNTTPSNITSQQQSNKNSRSESKQHSRNNSQISTILLQEPDWQKLSQFSELNFIQKKKIVTQDTKQKKIDMSFQRNSYEQVSPNQMDSRNSSQKKSSNMQQSLHQSKELERFFQKQITLNSTAQTPVQSSKMMFNLQYVIGIGGFGKVWKVQSKKTHKLYAMKEMNKALVITKKSVSSVMNERQLLSQIKHPFLVNMSTSFQDKENLYLIMDYLSGGDLRYHIGRLRRFSEEQTRFCIACIFVSLECLHSNYIIHRDIKPENLVLDSQGYIRVTDLGIARIMRADNAQDTSGTPGYMAPEVMCRLNHTYSVDYFALGVIGYEFMLGRVVTLIMIAIQRPYMGKTRKEIRDQILAKQVTIRQNELPDGWSMEAMDFINKLIQRKPQSRLGFGGTQEIKNHPWLRNFPWQKLINKELLAPFIPNSKADNFDSSQISQEDDENNDLIQQNVMLLRRNSVQSILCHTQSSVELFEGYSFEQPKQSDNHARKFSQSSHTQGAYQPSMQTQKKFFNQVDSLRASYQKYNN